MDSTGSALRDAAAKLRAGESQLLSQDPEQGFAGSTSTVWRSPFTQKVVLIDPSIDESEKRPGGLIPIFLSDTLVSCSEQNQISDTLIFICQNVNFHSIVFHWVTHHYLPFAN